MQTGSFVAVIFNRAVAWRVGKLPVGVERVRRGARAALSATRPESVMRGEKHRLAANRSGALGRGSARWPFLRTTNCALVLFSLLFGDVTPSQAAMKAWLSHGTRKIRPTDPVGAAITRIQAAKGEFEPLQVIVTAVKENIKDVEVTVSDLSDGSGHTIPARGFTVYKVENIDIFYRSNENGRTGEWPDILVPKVDPYLGEKRNTFPFQASLVSRPYRKYRLSKAYETENTNIGGGDVVVAGEYTGASAKTFTVEITKAGVVGVARFRWTDDGKTYKESVVSSAGPVSLKHGLTVAFSGTAFSAGSVWEFFASPSRNHVVWIDLYVPRTAAAGDYSGTITVSAKNQPVSVLPFRLTVFGFVIPATSSLPTYFGMSWYDNGRGHYGKAQDGTITKDLGLLYYKSALRNRITLSSGINNFPPLYTFKADNTVLTADYSLLDSVTVPEMGGEGMFEGATGTAITLPSTIPGAVNEEQKRNGLKALLEHFRSKGWYQRAFDYSYDEPGSSEDFQRALSRLEHVRSVDANVARLVTVRLPVPGIYEPAPTLVGSLSRWCPAATMLDCHPASSNCTPSPYAARTAYQERQDRYGEQFWWYQACNTHGCFTDGRGSRYRGYPQYLIDFTAMHNRVFQWLGWRYRIQGELYYDVNYAYGRYSLFAGEKVDVLESVLYFGGNGDGTLFYPGRPAQIGGSHHVPLESVRLKLIREGMEDYEYMVAAKSRGGDVDKIVEKLVSNVFTWVDDPDLLFTLRSKLAAIAQGPRVKASPAAPAAQRSLR